MDSTQAALLRAETPERTAIDLIASVLRDRHPLAVSWSCGKDSSAMLNLVMAAAIEVSKDGVQTPIIVTHSDTLVENPPIHQLARREITKIREYAKANGLVNFEVLVGTPLLSQCFQVRVIGGRAMPSYPTTRQDCTIDWKRDTQDRLRRSALERFSKDASLAEPVVATGVRLGESIKRDGDIRERRETGHRLWANEEGQLRLSPILHWETDDVWQYLGLCNAGAVPSYSDFNETIELYQDAGGSSCVVVADMAMASHAAPCQSRFGCWTCTMVRRDTSLRQMIASDPTRYGRLKLLADFRDFLANVQFDWSRRDYVGRTIDKNGYIRIAADGFAPALLADLLWYSLSIQAETGHKIITPAQLIAIDARWSLYGLHRPFEALRIEARVSAGERRFPPQIREYPKTPVPDYGKVFVGGDWNDDINAELFDQRYSDELTRRLYPTGLRDPLLELTSECGTELKVLSNGRVVIDYEGGPNMDVDDEGAADFLQFFGQEYADRYESQDCDWTVGFRTYLNFQTLSVPIGQSRMIDEIMRRTQWRQRNGLHGQRSVQELLDRLDVVHPRQSDLFDEWQGQRGRPAPVIPIAAATNPHRRTHTAQLQPAAAESEILAELLSL